MPNPFVRPLLFSLLLSFLLLPGVLSSTTQFDAAPGFGNYKSDFHYTKDGSLEINLELNPSFPEGKATLKPTLFFEEERENRHVFNLDVCVSFYDSKNTDDKKEATLILCYDGNLRDNEIVKKNPDHSNKMQVELKKISQKCTEDGKKPKRRGIELYISPPEYRIYSLVDKKIFKFNTTEFVRDPIRIPRSNMLPKYCLRLQMGQMPPDDEDVQAQKDAIQELLRNIRFDAEARNLTDNATIWMRQLSNVVLEVPDVKQEFMLRTVDFDAHPDARAPYQESERIFGYYLNATLESTTVEENITRHGMTSEKLYKDFVPKVKTDKNYHHPSWTNFQPMELHYSGLVQFVNLSFNGGNIFPCRSEWVELEKFTMERDFYHPVIHEHFSPVHIAYTVGLVGWKNESERGFGPGYVKKGKFGPSSEEIELLKELLPKTEGFLTLEKRYKEKFGDAHSLENETFHLLEDYYTPLQLNDQQPLGEVTVKQLVFTCGDHSFNLPHVASFVEGIGI